MIAAPDSALDLPLKILIAEEANGTTRVSYNAPAYMQERYGLPDDLIRNIAAIKPIAEEIAK
jgi:uncharacterized protein (DUF302 family)